MIIGSFEEALCFLQTFAPSDGLMDLWTRDRPDDVEPLTILGAEILSWRKGAERHRASDKPALIYMWRKPLTVKYVKFFDEGLLHREVGPAEIHFEYEATEVSGVVFANKGLFHNMQGPASVKIGGRPGDRHVMVIYAIHGEVVQRGRYLETG